MKNIPEDFKENNLGYTEFSRLASNIKNIGLSL